MNSFATVPTDRHLYNGGASESTSSAARQASPGNYNGAPVLDQNFNGLDDVADFNNSILAQNNSYLLTLNFSGAAQMSTMGSTQAGKGAASQAQVQARTQIYNNFPAIDVGYTYADINNAFLAYIGTEPTTGYQVVTPSFHRPAAPSARRQRESPTPQHRAALLHRLAIQ